MNIVGIAGLGRSGKDTLAQLYLEDGFYGVSGGDITRDFAKIRHTKDPYPISRENLTETSNWLRETRGPDVILKISLEKFEKANKDSKYKGLVYWSIRAPIEADFIISHGGHLIWVDVSDEVRYERAMDSLRVGEPKLQYDEFIRQENTQFKPLDNIPIEIQMDLPYVKSKATIMLENNNDDIREFNKKAKEIISQSIN